MKGREFVDDGKQYKGGFPNKASQKGYQEREGEDLKAENKTV